MGTQPATDLNQLGAVYCGIMDTVADRLSSISEVIAGIQNDPDNLNKWRGCEFCYLQIRKSIHYIALALLAAHKAGDYECEKLENYYKADVIFHDLSKLNPHGFAQAIIFEQNQLAGGVHSVEDIPALTKRRMKRIYDDCAVHLHSGTLEGILRQEIPPYDLTRVTGWRDELEALLLQHRVLLPDRGMVMLVTLREHETGRARVLFLQADGPMQVHGDTTIYNDNPA